MKKILKKSTIPVFGIAVLWLLWACFLPLYRSRDFLFLIALSVAAYLGLNKLFPGTEEEIPVSTGDGELDELLNTGRDADARYAALISRIKNADISTRAGTLRELTKKIFSDLAANPSGKSQARRFCGYFLSAPLDLLDKYNSLEASGTAVSPDVQRSITEILDTTADAYRKELDALFEGRVLDVETDIEVLRAMLKREGLSGDDFAVPSN